MAERVRRMLRRRTVLADALAVSPFLAFSLATVVFYTGVPELIPVPVYVAFTLALLLPLAFRRTCPLGVFAVVAVAAFGQWVAAVEPIPADLAVLVAMYTVAARCRLAWAVAALLTVEAGMVLAIARWFSSWAVLPSYAVLVVAPWIAGLYANMRRRHLAALEERADRLERERDAQAQIAAAAERSRIARELHDVVAHNVSVIVVQADGASYAIDHDPPAARRALEAISRTGRDALTEMRRLLGVLRADEGTGGPDGYTPQPDIAQLTGLVEQIRAVGLPVEFAVEGVPRTLSQGTALAAYRIVQEALTNTRKHAGPRAGARIRIRYGDDTLEVRVDDDGRGPGPPADGHGSWAPSPGGRDGHGGRIRRAAGQEEHGHGLIGMRERAAMLGGRLETGPRPGGGYRVVATLPLGGEP